MKPREMGMVSVWLMVVMLAGLMTGCASAPPSKTELRLFRVETNYVPKVSAELVTVTNEVVLWRTNIVEGVTTVSATTNVSVSAVLQGVTNYQAQYVFTPGDGAERVRNVGEAIAEPFGLGKLVGGVLGGVFGIWGLLRSRKANTTAAVLAQAVETGRALIRDTPQGQQVDAKFRDWLIKHQSEAAVLDQVGKLLRNDVDATGAVQQADAIKLKAGILGGKS